MKLIPCIEMLYKAEHPDFVQRFRAAKADGFDAVDMHLWREKPLDAMADVTVETGVQVFSFCVEPRASLVNPAEHETVLRAVRAAWPADKPMSVRISAVDWVNGGTTPDDAVAIARAFKAAGADLVDCSSGQVSKQEKVTYGRMFQTPFADRIRQEAGIATMAVGAISEADHVNSIIAAGRADLCAVARPHLANPAWILTEAAKIGFTQVNWPRQYRAGKTQMETLFAREKALAAAPAAKAPAGKSPHEARQPHRSAAAAR